MVDPVAVDHNAAQVLNGPQGAALSRAGAAGDPQNDTLAVRVDHMEGRRLLQAVPDGQAQAPVIRALGEDLLHAGGVEAAQSLKEPLGLDKLVAAGAQDADLLLGEEVGVLVEADDSGGGTRPPLDLPGGVHGSAGDHRHRGLGRVVAVFHAGGAGALSRLEGDVDGPVHVDVADQPLDVLHRQSAGAEEPGGLPGQVQHGGLHPHGAGPPVHDHVHPAAHVLHHVLGRGAAGPAGGVGAGGGDGHTRLPDDGQGDGVIGAADAHGVQPRRGLVGHRRLALQNHGQGPRPELPGQGIGHRGNVRAVPGQPLGPGDVENQGIVLGPPLHLEDAPDGGGIGPVGPQTVHRLRGDAHQAPLPENFGGGGNLVLNLLLLSLGVPQVVINRLHKSRLYLFPSGSPRRCSPSPYFSRSAVSAAARASMISSRSPFKTASSRYSVRPIRCSTTWLWRKR